MEELRREVGKLVRSGFNVAQQVEEKSIKKQTGVLHFF